MMNHREHPAEDELIDYAHHELGEREDAAVHAHVAQCASCAAAFENEVRLGELLRDHARRTERELPPELVDGIFERLREPSNVVPFRRWAASMLRPAIAIPVAAGLILGIYFGTAQLRGPAHAATIDAAYYLDDHAELATTAAFGDGPLIPAMLASDETPSR